MPSTLSDRASLRCEAHILRHYPAWRQAELRAEGGADLAAMTGFIQGCKEHLLKIRTGIAETQSQKIDDGWPLPADTLPTPLTEEEEFMKIQYQNHEFRPTPDVLADVSAAIVNSLATGQNKAYPVTLGAAEVSLRREELIDLQELIMEARKSRDNDQVA